MEKTVVGLYDDLHDAQAAVQELVQNGFPRERISLVAKDAGGRYGQKLGEVDQEVGQSSLAEEDGGTEADLPVESDSAANAAARGAGIGAALGGIAGLVVGLGAFVVPGIGPILAAGPLLSIISGLGIGAVTGGMIGALTDSGVTGEDANIYAEGVRRGGSLVLVHVLDDRADLAAEIMNRHHAADLQERSESWRKENFQGFSDSGESFAFDRQPKPYHERAPESELDYGPGARSYLAGKPVADVDRSDADLSHYTNRPDDAYYMYESRFRADYDTRYANSGKSWETYQNAYRFGFNEGHDPRFSNQNWEEIEDEIQRDWQRDYPGADWPEFQKAIRDGWEVGHVPH